MTDAVTAVTTTSYQSGAAGRAGGRGRGSTEAASEPATAGRASTIVSQLSQAKLPESTSHSWVAMMTPAAALATGCGVNNKKGTTSWAKWLAATSTRCNGLGRWWKNQLS